jgi:hypothetical protein
VECFDWSCDGNGIRISAKLFVITSGETNKRPGPTRNGGVDAPSIGALYR